MSDCVVLVPTLGRPQLIEPLLDSLYATEPDISVLFLTTPSDTEPRKVIERLGERFLDVSMRPKGDYARKINTGYESTTEPLMFLGATDLLFHPGWLEKAKARIDDQIQVVGTNDLGNWRVLAGKHSTHTLVTRDYIDKYGTIDEPRKVLCEVYPHEFCDDEFVQTAMHRNAFAMELDSIVEHLHPAWGKAEWDDSYREVDVRLHAGNRLYRRRRKLWT